MSATGYQAALTRLRARAATSALTRPERERLSALRDLIRKYREDHQRTAAARSVDEWEQRTQNDNGHRGQVREEETGDQYRVRQHTTTACSERRPEASYHGQPIYREGEQA